MNPHLIRFSLLASLVLLGIPSMVRGQAPAAVAPLPAAPASMGAEAFETLLKKGQRSPDALTPEEMTALLKGSVELARPFAVSVIARTYLSRNPSPAPGLLRSAAENARLCGDYRTAVSRYKQYLRLASPGMEASEVAAVMCWIQIWRLNNADDAFLFMAEAPEKYRETPAYRKLDRWFLDTAWTRKAYSALAGRLAAIMAEQRPIDLEKAFIWPDMDQLMSVLSDADPSRYGDLIAGKRIVSLVRDDPVRKARFNYYLANLEFRAGSAGKDDASLDKDFAAVAASARAYIDASPNAATVKDVLAVLGGGWYSPTEPEWKSRLNAKQELFRYAFSKMNDADRRELMAWEWWSMNQRIEWVTLGPIYPELFKSAPETARLTFPVELPNPVAYRTQAAFLQGVPSGYAALVNAMASSEDLWTCVQNLTTQSSPLLPLGGMNWYLQTMITAHSRFPRDAAHALPGGYYERVRIRFATEYLLRSPAALFESDMVRDAMRDAFYHSGTNGEDKSKLAGILHLADWIPYTDEARKAVFAPAYGEFKRWADEKRNQYETARKAKNTTTLAALEPVVAQLSPLENAFQEVMNVKVTDLNKAPSPLCQHLAKTVVAIREKNLQAYLEAARAAYPLVRDYEIRKIPHGKAIFDFLMMNRLSTFDSMEFQSEVLADQMDLWIKQGVTNSALNARFAIWRDRQNWGYWGGEIPVGDKHRPRLNEVITKATLDMFTLNKPNPTLFGWFVGASMDTPGGRECLTRFVEQKTLQGDPKWRYSGFSEAAPSYIWLFRSYYPFMLDKYPATYFDELYASEIQQGLKFDSFAYDWTPDPQGKIAKAVIAQLQTVPKVPILPLNSQIRNQYWRYYDWLCSQNSPSWMDQKTATFDKLEAAFGTTRFDWYAMGPHMQHFRVDQPDGRKQFFDKLRAFNERAALSHVPVPIPLLPDLTQLGKPETLSASELDALLRMFKVSYVTQYGYANMDTLKMFTLIHQALMASGRDRDLIELAPVFWGTVIGGGRLDHMRGLSQLGFDALTAGHAEVAASYAMQGLESGGQLPEEVRNALLAIKTKVMSGIGAVIPVERSDRRYPLFAAQASFQAGKTDTAWELYDSRRDLLLTEFRDIDPAFSIWIVEKLTEMQRYDEAETLGQKLIQWMDSSPQGFNLEDRVHLLVAYADVALARREYPRARAQYERIALAKEFDGTLSKRAAELKIAVVDRLTRHFDSATERLENLARRRDAYMQSEANYQMALVKFDQEDFAAAKDYVGRALSADVNHADARILEGQIFLKMKKLMEATEVKVGLSTSQRAIMPGRPLRVQLEDRNLAIVSKSVSIEVKAWSDSGDEEFITLLPFGDSKTKFEGELPTALGAPRKGDRVLQVLGGDKIHYDFSDKFKQASRIAQTETPSIDVISDADLTVSSGRLLSRREMEDRELERQIRARMNEADKTTVVALNTVRDDDEVKPGNPISVRVQDPDRCVKPGVRNTVKIRATASSGDSVEGFAIEEKEPFSGVFEGKIPTATAPATAFASDSEEACQPNYVISSGDYPPWVGLPDGRRPKTFSVDLNNNIGLGKMTILSDIPGRRLKGLTLHTSVNGKDFVRIGRWPEPLSVWDGKPRLSLVKYVGPPKPTLDAQRSYWDVGYAANGQTIFELARTNSAVTFDMTVLGYGDRMGLQDWSVPFLAHFEAAFVVTQRQTRLFRVDAKVPPDQASYFLTLDGIPASDNPLEISRSLEKGVHRINLYVYSNRGGCPSFELQCDSPVPPYIMACPPDMFDPGRQPALGPAVRVPQATVQANTASNTFNVAFPKDLNARIVRVTMTDFESDAPAIRRITLSGADGQPVLPPKEDIVKLKQNQILEIVPGDRISVIYEDPTCITKEKRVLEAFMQATFYNATQTVCFVDSVLDSSGNRVPKYIPMRRFKAGDPLTIFIGDPDCDVSDQCDTIGFTARASSGKPVSFTALETEPHSGIFIGKVFPVAGVPQRASELQVAKGEDVIVTYRDEQNTDYGVPIDRTYVVEQIVDATPQMRVYEASSRLLSSNELVSVAQNRHYEEYVPPARAMALTRSPADTTGLSVTGLIGAPIVVEITHPAIAQSPLSTATLYVQTLSGREKAGHALTNEFDVNVPGTIKYVVAPGKVPGISAPPGYRNVNVVGTRFSGTAIDDGRFSFVIPAKLGDIPEKTLVDEPVPDPFRMPTLEQIERQTLAIGGHDEVFIGFSYHPADAPSGTRWISQRVVMKADAFFDAMDRRYQQPVEALHVGEQVFLRVIDPARDTTPQKDSLTVDVLQGTNLLRRLTLTETFTHSGVFKGNAQLVFAGGSINPDDPALLPVRHGDSLSFRYQSQGGAALWRAVRTYKGADGAVIPFTKRFKDADIAVQTQFTVAESYFELAKKHRELKQESLSRREIAQGKKLLEEAIRDYPHTESRAQADYLLANLSIEYAGDAATDEAKKQYYLDAITRFSDIVATYPESPYAPKSQFKKALAFEKMGQIDQACEEYVKLSYRYPDNELVAETIARLGQYFLTKGKALQDQASSAADAVQKERIRLQSVELFRTAAQVFGRLAQRFPDHPLAIKTTVLSAQQYMRAEDMTTALEVFRSVIDNKKAESDLIAQSMYWSGDCYMKMKVPDFKNAYRMFKKLTWDYPESTWAKYARGRLSEEALAKLDSEAEK